MVIPFCVFNLPPTTGGRNWCLGQGMGHNSFGTCPPPTGLSIPFYYSGKRLLLSLWLSPPRTSPRNPDCVLVIPLRTLLNHILSKPDPSLVVLDWDTWGPTGSRLFAGVEARQLSPQFGWKITRLSPPNQPAIPSASREVRVTVYDFNPLPFHGLPDITENNKWAPQESEADAGGISRMVVTSPSSCLDVVGLGRIQTSLPYRVTSAPFKIRGRANDPVNYEISLGEDGMIVWTHVGSNPTPPILRIYRLKR